MKSDRYEYHRFRGMPLRLEEARRNESAGACVYYLGVGGLLAAATYIFFFMG